MEFKFPYFYGGAGCCRVEMLRGENGHLVVLLNDYEEVMFEGSELEAMEFIENLKNST